MWPSGRNAKANPVAPVHRVRSPLSVSWAVVSCPRRGSAMCVRPVMSADAFFPVHLALGRQPGGCTAARSASYFRATPFVVGSPRCLSTACAIPPRAWSQRACFPARCRGRRAHDRGRTAARARRACHPRRPQQRLWHVRAAAQLSHDCQWRPAQPSTHLLSFLLLPPFRLHALTAPPFRPAQLQ